LKRNIINKIINLLKDKGYADQETSYSIQRTMTMASGLIRSGP
jgi:hypothetical protein